MVVTLIYKPHWFIGHDVIIELLFAMIAFSIGFYAYKYYKLSHNSNAKYFGFSFFFLAIAYLTLSITNLTTIISLKNMVMLPLEEASEILLVNNIGFYIYALFYSLGILYLTFTTFKEKSKEFQLLIIMMLIVSITFVSERIILFYLLTTLLLVFVTANYLSIYFREKKKETKIIAISFVIFLIGRIFYALSVHMGMFYFIGHAMELIAYILILINLIRVLRK